MLIDFYQNHLAVLFEFLCFRSSRLGVASHGAGGISLYKWETFYNGMVGLEGYAPSSRQCQCRDLLVI